MPTRSLRAFWDRLDRPDSAALHGLLSGALWFAIAVTIGMTMSEELTLPDLFAGIPQLVFSRLRPSHVNMISYGFLSTAYFGAWYYMIPRLLKTTLRSNRVANLLLLVWNLTILGGTIALTNADTTGKEWVEYPWYIDWVVQAGLLANLGIFIATVAARREPKLYVSLWYIGGSLVWITILWAIGHVIWHPFNTYGPDGQVRWMGSITGLDDAVWNWFYGHNVLGLYVTTGGIAIIYYLVPKISPRPLYSHTMSLIGFWTIALFYTETGQHHLLMAPIPNWLKVLAIIGSIALIIPVFTQTTNIFMTMRGAWGLMLENIPLRFVLTGQFFYLSVSFQGSVQSLMAVNRFVHFTQWVIGHAHLALLGAFGFIVSGATLYMVPQIVRRPLWSKNLADAQFWLMLLGINLMFWSLTAAGLAQASAAINLGQQWVRLYPVVKPYFWLRSVSGVMIVTGVYMQLINVYMTVRTPALDAAARRRRQIAGLEEIPPLPREDRVAVVD